MTDIVLSLVIPFVGTALGASCVWMLRKEPSPRAEKLMLGFAAGVMVAAAIWSLLIPAMDINPQAGPERVVPAAVGFLCGMAFLYLIDRYTPHQHVHATQSEGPRSGLSRATKLALTITIHNIPEGIAVGIAVFGAIEHSAMLTGASALALAVGIALQNFPEGAIVAVPLRQSGLSKPRAFGLGVLSGLVEPVFALLTIMLASIFHPVLPYLLAFGAGSMLYVVVEELIPSTAEGPHSNLGTIGFALGFTLMMVLDAILG